MITTYPPGVYLHKDSNIPVNKIKGEEAFHVILLLESIIKRKHKRNAYVLVLYTNQKNLKYCVGQRTPWSICCFDSIKPCTLERLDV